VALHVTCPPCARGEHQGHYRIVRQLGAHDADICVCNGDCAQRLQRQRQSSEDRDQRIYVEGVGKARDFLEGLGFRVTPPKKGLPERTSTALEVAQRLTERRRRRHRR
jgi:hypothetical protein